MKTKNLYWLVAGFVFGFLICGVFPFVIFQAIYGTPIGSRSTEMSYLSLVLVSLIFGLGFVDVSYCGEKYLIKRKK